MEHNRLLLVALTTVRMPYGKFKNKLICDLPEYYLIWYQGQGFPPGKLGDLMASMYEIKLNGLEYLLTPLRKT